MNIIFQASLGSWSIRARGSTLFGVSWLSKDLLLLLFASLLTILPRVTDASTEKALETGQSTWTATISASDIAVDHDLKNLQVTTSSTLGAGHDTKDPKSTTSTMTLGTAAIAGHDARDPKSTANTTTLGASKTVNSKPLWAMIAALGMTQYSSPRNNLWVFTPQLSLQIRLNERYAIAVDWGLTVAVDTPETGDTARTVRFGNPRLKYIYWLQETSEDEWFLSLEGIAPIASLADGATRGQTRAGYALAADAQGLWDAWLWAPSQFGVAGGIGYRTVIAPYVNWVTEGALAGTLSIGDATEDGGDVYFQVATGLEFSRDLFHVSGRFQTVAVTADSDALQLSVVPSLSIGGSSFRVSGEVVVNLDGPLGFLGQGLGIIGGLITFRGAL